MHWFGELRGEEAAAQARAARSPTRFSALLLARKHSFFFKKLKVGEEEEEEEQKEEEEVKVKVKEEKKIKQEEA